MDQSEEDLQVMSEVHLGSPPDKPSCLSIFTIASSVGGKQERFTAENITALQTYDARIFQTQGTDLIDGNGDLNVPRRKQRENAKDFISIHHLLKTTIPYVGLQVWRGALLLSDFLLHKMQTTHELDDVNALELGAGTGIVGIILARKARIVFLTDYGIDILDNCYRNIILNSHSKDAHLGTLRIRQLDWQESWPLQVSTEMSANGDLLQYSWIESDLVEVENVSIILAADVIYNDSLTEAFFRILEKLMPSGSKKVLWLALEKRYNFSLSDVDVVAHGYNCFRSFLKDSAEGSSKMSRLLEYTGRDSQQFIGKQLEVDQVPQYITEYKRTSDLELWEIRRK